MQTARQRLGQWGEFRVFDALRGTGLTPHFPTERHAGDIAFALDGVNVRVEVKTSAQKTHDSHYRFCLLKNGFTSHLKSDYVVLVCVSAIGLATFFVIPVQELANQKHIKLTPNLRGSKYSKWITTEKGIASCLTKNARSAKSR